MMAVTLIVVAVPEGLPMSVTLSLALNMRRMLENEQLSTEKCMLVKQWVLSLLSAQIRQELLHKI